MFTLQPSPHPTGIFDMFDSGFLIVSSVTWLVYYSLLEHIFCISISTHDTLMSLIGLSSLQKLQFLNSHIIFQHLHIQNKMVSNSLVGEYIANGLVKKTCSDLWFGHF